jgi:anti-sigma factor RsiW
VKRDPSTDERELHQAADGQLPPDRRDALAARLTADGAAAAQVDFYRRLNEGLHRLYDPVLTEPYETPLPRSQRARPVLGSIAAAILLLLVGAGGGWLGRGWFAADEAQMAETSLPRLAADAHLIYTAEVRHPVEVGADQEAHLVQWLSKRLGAQIMAPNHNPQGYRLIGGRLLPAGRTNAGQGVAGQFMYENPSGLRLTLFLVSGRARDETAFRFAEEDGVSVFYWRDGGFGYALSAAMPREALLAVCNEIYAQLNPGAGPSAW